MKVCFLTSSYPRYEGDDHGIFIRSLACALGHAGENVKVIAPGDKLTTDDFSDRNVEVRRFRYGLFARSKLAFGSGVIPNLKRAPWLIFQVPLFLLSMFLVICRDRKEIDIIVTHWAPLGIVAYIAQLFFSKPFVLVLHGSDVRLLEVLPVLRPIQNIVCRKAGAVIGVSRWFCSFVASMSQIEPHRICWVPYGINQEIIDAPRENVVTDWSNGTLLLVAIGSVIPRKNQKALVSILSLSELSKAHLILLGCADDEKYLREIMDIATKRGVDSRIKIFGRRAPGEVHKHLLKAHLFVTASLYEGRPNAVLEALASGAIVFASDIPAHREIVEHSKNGFLFDPDSPYTFLKYFILVRDNRELREEISRQARESVSGYSWDDCAKQYVKICRQIICDNMETVD